MDMNDMLRGFFGINRVPPNRRPVTYPPPDDEDISDNRDPVADGVFDDGFHNLFRHIEDMFDNMFSIHSGFLDFPNLEMPPNETSPRDIMLKEPSCPNCEKSQHMQVEPFFRGKREALKDVDLDEVIEKSGFAALNRQEPFQEITPQTLSFRKSVSTKIIRSADGVIEEHRSSTDSDGKTITTVRKTMGDKTYQVRTESDKQGLVEKKEDFINIDESNVKEFEQEWGQARSIPSLLSPQDSEEKFPTSAPPGDPKYLNIFRKFFG